VFAKKNWSTEFVGWWR